MSFLCLFSLCLSSTDTLFDWLSNNSGSWKAQFTKKKFSRNFSKINRVEIAFIKNCSHFLCTQIIWFRPTKMYQFMDYINGDVHYPMVIDNDFDCFVAFCCEWWIGFQLKCLKSKTKRVASTAKNTVISPDFPVWRFCGKAKFPHSFGRTTQNFTFPQNFHTRKSGEITLFFAV